MTTTSSSEKSWRVAMIGAGTIVQLGHIPRFKAIPNVEVAAVVDVNEARARLVAEEAGIPHVYSDYKQMLAEVKPNVVVVATPNVFHKSMSIDALQAGAHVLCEKPLALSYADAAEMMEVAAANHRVLTVGTHYRWTAPVRAAKAHVDQGFFGEIYAARTVWHRRSGIPGYGSWFTNKDLAGGGALLDIGIHALDRALYLMGYPKPVTVSGVTYAKFGTRGMGLGGWGADRQPSTTQARFDVDDLTWGFVRFENGASLQFQVSWAAHTPTQFQTEIFGTDGGASVGDKDQVELYTNLGGQDVVIRPDIAASVGNSYERLIQNFVRYLDGDPTAEIITPREALIAVQIIEGLLKSAETGQEVRLG
ncbi:MAG: Gfo/Idh/MocA family oxidoreductase [Caldilineaceae bacterium]|nr:Gfo/Idh/MocA family oxidoreductase [Caldilineaceae bacterium]